MEGPDILVDMAIVAFGCATLGPIGDRDAMRGLRRGGVTGTSADAMVEPARAAASTFSTVRGMAVTSVGDRGGAAVVGGEGEGDGDDNKAMK